MIAVTLQPADQGDTTTMKETLGQAGETVAELAQREVEKAPQQDPQVHVKGIEEVVADKGYHSGPALVALEQAEVRSYIPEPQRGRRKWAGKEQEQKAVYDNRRRVKGSHGKRELKKRGELLERSFAHVYETGGMRKLHLRGCENVLKRLLIHIGGFNLSLIFRRMLGAGTPRELQNVQARLGLMLLRFQIALRMSLSPIQEHLTISEPQTGPNQRASVSKCRPRISRGFATGC